MEKVTLVMSKELKERLQQESIDEKRSISNYIITRFIKNQDAPAPQKNFNTEGGKEVIVEKIVEVDKIASKLPQPVIDFYQERALDKDGDLYNCLADNLIDRAIVGGVKLEEDSPAPESKNMGGREIEISREAFESMKKANKKLAEIQGRNMDDNTDIKRFKEKHNLK